MMIFTLLQFCLVKAYSDLIKKWNRRKNPCFGQFAKNFLQEAEKLLQKKRRKIVSL